MELQRNRFRDVPTPSTFNRLPTQSFFETSTSTLESIVGRMKSSSRYQRFLKEKPEEAAKMIEDIESEMKTIVAKADLAKVVIENRIEYFAVVLVKKSWEMRLKKIFFFLTIFGKMLFTFSIFFIHTFKCFWSNTLHIAQDVLYKCGKNCNFAQFADFYLSSVALLNKSGKNDWALFFQERLRKLEI